MNLVRGIGRMLLGGYYISNGMRALRHPAEFADATQSLADRLAPLAQRFLPDSATGLIPENGTTLVRVCGVASVAGGLGMSLGIGSQAAGSVAAASMIPTLLATNPRGVTGPDKALRKSLYLRTVALFGAALIVSQDTKGQPSMLWKAKNSRAQLERETKRTRKALARQAAKTSDEVKKSWRQATKQARKARKSIEVA